MMIIIIIIIIIIALQSWLVQSAGAAEYTDCISAKG